MDGDPIHGEDHEFRFGHTDLEKFHPSGVTIKHFEMKI